MLIALVMGFGEIMLLSGILFLIFGASQMPKYSGAIKKSFRSFRRALGGSANDEDPAE